MAGNKDYKQISSLIGSIKIEPGTSASPGRLPSFRGARDLTLGALTAGKTNIGDSKQRKVYRPNVNVQRNKNKDDGKGTEQHPRWRDNKKERDPRPNRTRNANYVQSTGIFSEGLAAGEKKRGTRVSYGSERDNEATFIPKPKLNLTYERKFDKEEDEQKLKELLRDDFVDDPAALDKSFAPVELPMIKREKNVKQEIKTEVKPEIKKEKDVDEIEKTVISVKQEKPDKNDVETMQTDFGGHSAQTGAENEMHRIFNSTEPQLIFFQFPDCLPGLKPEQSSGPARPSTARPSTAARPSTSAKPPAPAEHSANETDSDNSNRCTLKDLSEGLIGKVQLLKSGRARLVLGDTVLNLEMGTQLGFRQDVICVNLDPSTHGGEMINLGPVNNRIICSPDLETMLATTKA
ncbi:DNA-directed RNA polymerase III subunit RPC4 [Schistocerca serialis cubense]|uniref:DNA-directed RNA polymerase III subunit RPC4 n=1 Tax=Schistocerca cancellata TaxID=274614 RepID=UPI0021176667|nr:DNA-directed RNA polymerase III subunit RPC4 [Schistocerca cancellata]XP_049943058.1 DNA-directed RNA polymerase III subunit RPC4 [Schistocerca serialis cubense]